MTTTVIRPTRISGAGPIPRGTCLGKQNPSCTSHLHGTHSAYRAGCRCPHAREATRIYRKRHRENRDVTRFVDDTGTRRRLRALSAIGWRWQDMAEHLGTSAQNIQNFVVRDRGSQVMVNTHERVRVLYARLSTAPGPSVITRRRAAAKGWASPLAWDDDAIDDPQAQPNLGGDDTDLIDDVAIERALNGERVRLTRTERDHAFHVGLARGMSATAIGDNLHMSGAQSRAIAARIRETQAA